MNKIKTMLCAASTLLLISVGTSGLADSGNFAGPYIALSGLAVGAAADGTGTGTSDASRGSITKTKVNVGKAALGTGVEIGYALPIGETFLLDLGGSYLSGEAKLSYSADNDVGANTDVSFKVDKFTTIYIAPTIALSDTSSLYVKVGLTEADIGVSGDITTPGDLSGTTWAIGTRTVLESGIFIRTEAGYTDYNGISAHGKTTDTGTCSDNCGIKTSSSYSAEPTIAYGKFSLGFRF